LSNYNMAGLQDLAGCPTIPVIIERIDNAATRATALFRALGMTLDRRATQVPLLDHVDTMLRELVVDAAEQCFAIQEAGKREQAEKPFKLDAVEAVADNDLFRVVVKCDDAGHLDVNIQLHLV